MSVAQDLLKAAEIMKERGCAQGTGMDKWGRVCALGAIALATAPEFMAENSGIGHLKAIGRSSRARAAVQALACHLGDRGRSANHTVWSFNDRPGLFRGRRVVKAFKRAAAELT
jgi:hypothetical protein